MPWALVGSNAIAAFPDPEWQAVQFPSISGAIRYATRLRFAADSRPSSPEEGIVAIGELIQGRFLAYRLRPLPLIGPGPDQWLYSLDFVPQQSLAASATEIYLLLWLPPGLPSSTLELWCLT